jgi:hypothetical protein
MSFEAYTPVRKREQIKASISKPKQGAPVLRIMFSNALCDRVLDHYDVQVGTKEDLGDIKLVAGTGLNTGYRESGKITSKYVQLFGLIARDAPKVKSLACSYNVIGDGEYYITLPEDIINSMEVLGSGSL